MAKFSPLQYQHTISRDLTLFFIIVSIIASLLVGTIAYFSSYNMEMKQFRQDLSSIAQGGTLLVDASQHQKLLPGDEATKFYQQQRKILQQYKQQTGINYAYTLVKSSADHSQFVIDTDPQNPGKIGKDYHLPPAMQLAFEGNPSVEAKAYHDEWGTFISAYAPIVDAHGQVTAILAVDKDISYVQSLSRAILIRMILACLLAILIAALIGKQFSKKISRPVVELTKQAEVMAGGQLNVEFSSDYSGELGILSTSLQNMVANTRAILSSINTCTSSLDQSVASIFRASSSTAAATEQVAETVSQISAGNQEMAASTTTIASSIETSGQDIQALGENVRHIEQNARETMTNSSQGKSTVESLTENIQTLTSSTEGMNTTMLELTSHADQINGITSIITGIADQTNLLALNAAIEAARAGEAGRGFSVVADEIRKLAEQSNAQAKEIATIIDKMSLNVNKSSQAANTINSLAQRQSEIGNHVLQQFTDITDETEQSAQLLEQVNQEVKDLIKQSQGITSNIGNIAAASEENAASAQEITASTEEMSSSMQAIDDSIQSLTKLMQDLKNATQNFQL